ncbi:hypothetical protein [Streptomyces chumphonensis]|uniref:hypothetical protein n=1 Tax=Streptomyces chumphonensis TaxID=1214925 RepID=UPI003D75F32B
MSGPPSPATYRCAVLAEGVVYGTGATAPYILGAFQTLSPVLALRWLRAQALRIADRLDPDPHRAAWVRPFMRMPTVPAPDAPALLRAWAAASAGRSPAREYLKAGRPLSATFPDTDCTYTLSIHPARSLTEQPTSPRPGCGTCPAAKGGHPIGNR